MSEVQIEKKRERDRDGAESSMKQKINNNIHREIFVRAIVTEATAQFNLSFNNTCFQFEHAKLQTSPKRKQRFFLHRTQKIRSYRECALAIHVAFFRRRVYVRERILCNRSISSVREKKC